ncbi:hypothetical protein [Zavarzinella formosa]|nr:hypothetical protein [Zavarzinella formosa]
MRNEPKIRDRVFVIRDPKGKLDKILAEGCDPYLEQMDDDA